MPVKRAVWRLGLIASAWLVVVTMGAEAKGRGKRDVVFDEDWQTAPSAKYGAMDADGCRSELRRRKIAFTQVEEAPGVLAPVRIPEGVGGIGYHTLLPEKKRATSPWEVFDCRLVLALHDFSAILAEHDVDDVVIFSAWRPPRKGWPEDKLARRHPGALAVDIMRLRKRVETEEGESETVWIDVKKDFQGRVGDRTCGPKGRGPRRKTDEAKALRAIVCEAAEARIFTSMLTPNYDRHHHDHLHLEVTPKVKWRMVR